jgi:predicted nucleic acid-binding protein
MIEVVLDASVVLRWAFEDETDRTGAVRVEQALREARIRAVEPPLFLLEVAAALERGMREGRIDRTQSDAVLGALDLVTFEEVDPHAFATATFKLALATGLRVPDAAYVEVAGIRRATLVTADRRQREAAEQAGIAVVAISDLPPW